MTVSALVANGVADDSYVQVPTDTTGNRPSAPAAGMIRFNSTLGAFEGYDGVQWDSFVSTGANGSFVDLVATGDIVLGDSCIDDTLTITAVTTVNCDMVIGTNPTTTVGFGSLVSTDIIPNLDLQRNLGSAGARWANIHTDNLFANNISGIDVSLENLTLTGDTVIGNDCAADTLTITSATTFQCDILASPDNTINLGSPTQRFANIYTGDLHLKNDRGDWTMIEEEDFLSLRNNTTGKTFKISMEPVD